MPERRVNTVDESCKLLLQYELKDMKKRKQPHESDLGKHKNEVTGLRKN